jgi:hypothetical protein
MRMKMLALLVLLAAGRPAWQWTDEERIAARFDESARRTRIEARLRTRGEAKTAGPPLHDVLQGADHPELLLPHEIFGTFTRAAYAAEDETAKIMRQDAAEKASQLGLPANFLDVVAREAADFIALQKRETALRDRMTAPGENGALLLNEIKRLEAEECPARAAAIGRLRTIYGRETFDRYLYTALAPGVFFTFFEPQDAQQLRARERGCQ